MRGSTPIISRAVPSTGEGSANHRLISAKFALPIGVGEQDRFWGGGRVVLPREKSPKRGLDAEHGEHAVSDIKSVDVLGLADAGDGKESPLYMPTSCSVLLCLAIDEVDEKVPC